MLFPTKRSRGNAQRKEKVFGDDDNSPPHLIEDSDEDEDLNKTYSSKKRPHHRNTGQKLRLFLLTGRAGFLQGIQHIALFVGAMILLFYILSYRDPSSNIPHADRLHVLQEAGFSAKPRMMGVYFTDVSSDSFTHKVHSIVPPQTHEEWHQMLHHQVERLEENQQQHHHHRQSRKLQLQIPEDPMLNDEEHLETQREIREDSEDYAHSKPRLTENPEVCTPQHDWQVKSYPVCNMLHEHSMMGDRLYQETASHRAHGNHHNHNDRQQLRRKLVEVTEKPIHTQYRLLAHGYWRDTWRMSEPGSTPLAFKTMRYEHDVNEYILDKQRRDSLTSDRVQFSDQTVKMYAYCGTSALYEYAPGGDLYKLLEQFDTAEDWLSYYSSEERYILAYNVTTALADLHNTESDEQPTAIVHGDFNAYQFVAITEPEEDDVGGVNSRHHHHHSASHKLPHFKLGDFNLARFVYWNQKHNHPCVIRPDARGGEFRAPEEYARQPDRTEKVDIYSLGNLIYSIVTGNWPFEKELDHPHGTPEMRALVKSGKRPHISNAIFKSEDPYVQAMLHAVNMCWPQDPNDRATAREVQDYLAQHLPATHHNHHHHHHRHRHHHHREAEDKNHHRHHHIHEGGGLR